MNGVGGVLAQGQRSVNNGIMAVLSLLPSCVKGQHWPREGPREEQSRCLACTNS